MRLCLNGGLVNALLPPQSQNSRGRTQVARGRGRGCNCCQNLPARVKYRRSELVVGFEGVRQRRGRAGGPVSAP